MKTNKNGPDSFKDLENEIRLRKEAEEQARLAELNYRTIFNNSSEAIAVHELHSGRILDCNETLLEMYRISKEKVLASKISDFSSGQHPYDQENAVALVKKAIEEGPQRFEWLAKRHDNTFFWGDVT